MRRLDTFTIVIIAVCLIAAGLLIWIGWKKMNGTEDPNNDTAALYEEAEKDDYYYLDEDKPADEDDEISTPATITDEPQNTSTYDSDADRIEEEPITEGKQEDQPLPNNYSTEGAYLVLAGSFKIELNAESHARNIRSKGYSNTGVERFDRGAYAVVMVDRFNNYEDAKELVDKLKTEDNIDAYVKKK